jgi:hypothetical protein
MGARLVQDLITCGKCDKVFSSKLKSCPHCSSKNVGKGCLWVVGIVLVLALLGSIFGSDKSSSPQATMAAETPSAPLAPKPPQIAVMALTAIQRGDGMLILGRTNLPFGTQMLVNIEKPNGATLAQDNATVGEFGRFYAGPYATEDAKVPDGRYIIHVVAAIADVQPENVKPAIGKDWSNFLGPLKSTDGVIGPVIESKWPINWINTPGQRPTPLNTVLPAGEKMAQADVQWASDAATARVTARAAAWQEKRGDAFYACQTFIKRNLRDPDSADFMTRYSESLVTKSGDGGYQVTQEVRANNGFGGKTVSIFECETHLSGDNWQLDNVQEKN